MIMWKLVVAKVYFLASLALVLATTLAALAGQGGGQETEKKVKGQLLAPKEGGNIGEEFEVRAKISGDLPKGSMAVPAVESRDGVLIWAKRPYLQQFKQGGEWSATVSDGGTSKDLRVTVLIVPPDGLKVLADWFKKGEANGDFPGLKLEQITGAYRLDSVKVQKR